MKRERGITLLTTLLSAAAGASDRPLTMLDEIHVFGSFARGALEPHDIDVAVEFTPDRQYATEAARAMSRGQDCYAPIRRALVGAQRGVQFRFHELSMLHDEGIETTALWRRGEDLPTALARLHAITPDPDAGRAPRDAMLPAFEGIDRHVPRPVREMLSAWAGASAISVERIDLPAHETRDELARKAIHRRWAETSVLRRAAHACVSHLQQGGARAAEIHLHGRDIARDHITPYFIGFQWRYFDVMHRCLTHWNGIEWLEVPHPTANGLLTAIHIKVTDRAALEDQQSQW